MDPDPIFYILFTTPAAIICFLLLAVIPTVFHTVFLTLCSARPERLTTFRRSSSPTGSIKPWVDYSREICCCLHHNLPLGVHQLVAIKPFSGAVAGDLEATGKGSLSVLISLLFFCSCFSFVLLAVKNQKPKNT